MVGEGNSRSCPSFPIRTYFHHNIHPIHPVRPDHIAQCAIPTHHPNPMTDINTHPQSKCKSIKSAFFSFLLVHRHHIPTTSSTPYPPLDLNHAAWWIDAKGMKTRKLTNDESGCTRGNGRRSRQFGAVIIGHRQIWKFAEEGRVAANRLGNTRAGTRNKYRGTGRVWVLDMWQIDQRRAVE